MAKQSGRTLTVCADIETRKSETFQWPSRVAVLSQLGGHYMRQHPRGSFNGQAEWPYSHSQPGNVDLHVRYVSMAKQSGRTLTEYDF